MADIAFDAEGTPLEAMPTHNEMSDAVFMAGPVLAQAGVSAQVVPDLGRLDRDQPGTAVELLTQRERGRIRGRWCHLVEPAQRRGHTDRDGDERGADDTQKPRLSGRPGPV